jgi:hypothetical protein
LLPSMPGTSRSLIGPEVAIRRKRLSQDRFSLHSAYMASEGDCGFNEFHFRVSVEKGACGTYVLPRINAEPYSIHRFTETLLRQH